MRGNKGFTIIELLIVVSIIGLMMTVTLPVSFDMYARYKASLKAQELMVVISDLRRESFLYSENTVLSANNNVLNVNGRNRGFDDIRVKIDKPIVFFKNGTTSGGFVNLIIGDYAFALHIQAPRGDMSLENGLKSS